MTSVLWKSLGITAHGYYTPNGTSTILAPIASGVLRALIYVFTLKINCCGGGVDIIASVTKKFKPHYDLMYIIFGINTAVSLCSFFVLPTRSMPPGLKKPCWRISKQSPSKAL
ncbi:MAG: YitT family protein [Clostridia bacterium]|nr:YitT family protein [Clostridia bacterium]